MQDRTKPKSSSKFNPKLAFLWPAFLMAVIFTLSACSAEKSDAQSGFLVNIFTSIFSGANDIDLITTIIRKTAHFLEYALLGFLLARAYSKNINAAKNSPKMILFSVITAALYSTTDEVHQAFVPGRSCEIRDIIIDSFGATVGASIYFLICKKRTQKNKKAQETSL